MANSILVLYLADLTNAARVQRQVETLAARYQVTVAAFGGRSTVPDVDFVTLSSEQPATLRRRAESAGRIALRLGGAYHRAYWLDGRVRRWRQELEPALPADAIVVNDLFGLPLARAAGGHTPVVFDALEHWTSESASWTKLQRVSMRRAHEWIVDRYVPETAGVMTVSAGIARAFSERAGVSPRLVTNAPFFRALSPSEVTEPIRLLYVGAADERRRLEDTIDAVRSLDDRFTLDLILVWDNPYRRRLERLTASDSRIKILPPVPTRDLIGLTNSYDVGVFSCLRTTPIRFTCSPTSCSTTYRRDSRWRSARRQRWQRS